MKTKDVWLRLKCDISAVILMTSSVVAESSCLQWRKYDVDFDMHHPLCFHLRNRNQFTVTQSYGSQYIPGVRCLLFFAFACYQSKMISFFYSSDLHPEKSFCHFLRIIWKVMWYCLIFFPSFLVFYVAFYLTFYSGILFCIILTSYLASILVSILKFLWHSFWHSIWHLFWHSFWHLFWHSFLAFYLASILTFSLACVEVRHCPLRCGAWGSGQAVPTEIWSSRLTSGSAHPLKSGACGWGSAMPTEIRSSRFRSGSG